MKSRYPVWVVLISLFLLVSVVSADDPWAGFVPSSISGTAPYTVTFVSISYNSPTAWNWSFRNIAGNNTEVWFSQETNATLTFNWGGNYSIRLNSSNSDGYNITPYLVFVNVTGPTLPPDPTPTPTPTTVAEKLVQDANTQSTATVLLGSLIVFALIAAVFFALLVLFSGGNADIGYIVLIVISIGAVIFVLYLLSIILGTISIISI